ncbi:MAG: hypothetical protein CFE21_04580 [Bacteroidetes bacterium B1(2017)]|nr:MAG: hypothetical protein CFE21_04580 [Bacteroidetes bacterium B1(2017)]
MRMKRLFFMAFALSSLLASAQVDSTDYNDDDISMEWLKPSDDEKSRLGIIMGTQICTLTGTALPDNKPMFGLLGGGYGRINFRGGWSIQQELQVSFRGSNFKANPGDVGSFRFLYLDVPLLVFKQLGNKSKHKIGVGAQYSNLINGLMYLDKKSYPTAQAPKLDKNDWAAVLAYQYQFEYFALQCAVKSGFRNLNLGYAWPDLGKPLNNNGTLNNFAVELNIIF